MDCIFKKVSCESELDAAMALEGRIFYGHPYLGKGEYARQAWLRRIPQFSALMLYAEASGEVAGIVFGRPGGNGDITVGPVAMGEKFRGRGIASALMAELERQAKKMGYRGLALVSLESAEGFYQKLGFTPMLLVQAKPPLTMEKLRAVNRQYPEAWSYDDGADFRLCILTGGIDRRLQRRYEEELPGCNTQTFFYKRL